MAHLYLVRHGETDWNRQRKLQGHTDIPLNARGLQQAESLRELLSSHTPTHLFSSDLQRAQQTAQTAFPSRTALASALLREINLGLAEGHSREKIQELYGAELWNNWADAKFSSYATRFPSGESRIEGLQRLFNFLRSLGGAPKDAVIFGFTHGLLLRSFAQWAHSIEESRFETPNCCVYEWELPSLDLHFESPPVDRPRLRQILLIEDQITS